jgi:hypothetical protein
MTPGEGDRSSRRGGHAAKNQADDVARDAHSAGVAASNDDRGVVGGLIDDGERTGFRPLEHTRIVGGAY